jgi:hypothetical protein
MPNPDLEQVRNPDFPFKSGWDAEWQSGTPNGNAQLWNFNAPQPARQRHCHVPGGQRQCHVPGGQRASRLVGVHLTKRCGTATIGRCQALFPMALQRRCRAPWSSTWRQPLCSLPPAAMPTRGPSPLFRRFRRFRRMPTRGPSPLAPTIPSRPKPRLCGHGNRRAGDLNYGRPTPHSHTLPTYSPQTHTLPTATHSPQTPLSHTLPEAARCCARTLCLACAPPRRSPRYTAARRPTARDGALCCGDPDRR